MIKGRNNEPAKDIKENNTSASEPLLAMSPTGSVEDFNSCAFAESWR